MLRTGVRWLLRGVLVLVALIAFAFWLAFFSARPPLTTDPATLAGDGASLDYCRLPELDGRGKLAADIPKGNTPGCGYDHFPLPILRECTEPLPPAAADIRGLWQAVSGKVGHVERIEQCGSRVVVTAAGIIHDYGPNSTAGLNTNDTEGSVSFTIGNQEYCPRTSRKHDLERSPTRLLRLRLGPAGRAALSGRRRPDLGVRRWQRHAHAAHLRATARASHSGPARSSFQTVGLTC